MLKKPRVPTPYAMPGTIGAATEVELTDEVYVLNCSAEEARLSAADHLIGLRLRIITGEHYRHGDASWVYVMPEDEETASCSGVRRMELTQVQ